MQVTSATLSSAPGPQSGHQALFRAVCLSLLKTGLWNVEEGARQPDFSLQYLDLIS